VPRRRPSEANRAVAGAGIFVTGWSGEIDANAEKAGQTIKDAKLAQEGKVLHVTTGPAVTVLETQRTRCRATTP
jgi:hypothetical protein